jgi:hypothetical protein
VRRKNTSAATSLSIGTHLRVFPTLISP